ncbi:MAG: hypothetical protein ACM3UV_00265 [Nocardioidaceae bacterium]
MAYALENALFQWREGERRAREAPELDAAVDALVDELRRRLGSSFVLRELADAYAAGTDWAEDLAVRRGAGADAAHVVDAAFGRYAREASDYAGGRARHGGGRA